MTIAASARNWEDEQDRNEDVDGSHQRHDTYCQPERDELQRHSRIVGEADQKKNGPEQERRCERLGHRRRLEEDLCHIGAVQERPDRSEPDTGSESPHEPVQSGGDAQSEGHLRDANEVRIEVVQKQKDRVAGRSQAEVCRQPTLTYQTSEMHVLDRVRREHW